MRGGRGIGRGTGANSIPIAGNVPFQRGGMATRGNGGPVSNENGQRMPFTAPNPPRGGSVSGRGNAPYVAPRGGRGGGPSAYSRPQLSLPGLGNAQNIQSDMPPPPMTPRTPGGGVFGAGIGLLKPKAHSTPNRQPDPAASLPAVTVQTTAVESSASSIAMISPLPTSGLGTGLVKTMNIGPPANATRQVPPPTPRTPGGGVFGPGIVLETQPVFLPEAPSSGLEYGQHQIPPATPRTPGGGVFGAGLLPQKSTMAKSQVQPMNSMVSPPPTSGLGTGLIKPMQPLSMPTSSGWENEPLRPVVQGQPSPAPTSGLGAGIGIMKPPFQQVVGNQVPFGASEGANKQPDHNNVRFSDSEPVQFGDQATTTVPYAPQTRSVLELFSEDADNVDEYRQVTDSDCKITISGGLGPNFSTMDKWSDLTFDPKLLQNITKAGYIRPRPIQGAVIPLVFEGSDLKGQAETGSGKTAAFLIPIIQKCLSMQHTASPDRKPRPFAIVIEPTRELCEQVHDQGRKFASGLQVKVCRAYGQYATGMNLREINAGCEILCMTPGRFKHYVTSRIIELNDLKFLVLDEADHLLEKDFTGEVLEVISGPEFAAVRDRQTLLFSATFPAAIQEYANRMMRANPIFVSNMQPLAANQRIIQKFVKVASQVQKGEEIMKLLKTEFKEYMHKNPTGKPRALVFIKTKRDADRLALLCGQTTGLIMASLHGDRSQLQRETAINEFRAHKVDILFTTDVCARGIDIKDLDLVINYDLPSEMVTYVHRIGRTGRIRLGTAISFFDPNIDNQIAPDLANNLVGLQQEIPDCLKDFVQVNFNSGYNLPPSTSFTPQAAATVDTGHSFSTTPKAANVGTADPYSPPFVGGGLGSSFVNK